MDKNVFRTELDRVSFTPAGREALTDALMRAGAAPPVRRPVNWAKRGMAAALAAAALIGSAVAAGTLWDQYFGHLDEDQQEVIETLSRELPAAESNGTTMTPLAAFGDQDFYYLMLEIRAPEGTVLPDYGEDEGFYQLFGDTLEEDITLTDAGGQDAGDGAVLNIGDDGVVGLAQGGGADTDVFQAHVMNLLHDHVHHIVALPEVVVEGDGHAVVSAALLQRLPDGVDQLAPGRVDFGPHGGRRLGILLAVVKESAAENVPAGDLQNLLGDIAAYCVDHTRSPP